MSATSGWHVHNPGGSLRVIVTKQLPGQRWLEVLTGAGARVEVCEDTAILTQALIVKAIGEWGSMLDAIREGGDIE